MKSDRFIAVVLALCVFGFQSQEDPTSSKSPTNVRTIPQVYASSQSSANVRTIPRLGGCWLGKIRVQNLKEQVLTGPFRLGTWADEDYRICFGYELHPRVSVAVTELETRSSRSDIVRVDDTQVILTNHLILVGTDPDRGTSLPRHFEIEQTTEFQGSAENGHLIVKATAIGKRDRIPAYRIAWQATFYRQ